MHPAALESEHGMEAIDLFCGSGGLSIGLTQAGISVRACVEINRDAMSTYVHHNPDAIHFNEDVRGVDFSRFRGDIDLVAGGPPCQPFSIGGLRRGRKDERDMIPEFIRCLNEARPEAFIMENVPGLMLKKSRAYFMSVLEKLRQCGYRLNWAILNSADFGVPQKRRRLFVLGAKRQHLRFPMPTHGERGAAPHRTAMAALGPDPIGESPNCPVKFARDPDLRPSPYAGHIYNGGGRPIDPDGPCHTILASAGGYKTHWIDTLGVAFEYHAHLMAGGKPRDGYVPGARRLSVEESAILQGFPSDLVFSGKRSAQYKQVGDAVPPGLARSLAVAVRSQLAGAAEDNQLEELPPLVHDVQKELPL
jgi:DNA (cytosine-5)-methyltransferase 1